MSVRSYTKIWLHLIWGTHNRNKLLLEKSLRKELSTHLYKYSKEKGNSSFWINKKLGFKFSWARRYGAFSVSESVLSKVKDYIRNQEEHHRKI